MAGDAPPPALRPPVLLVHGFGVPARSLAPLARWLDTGGWDVDVAPIGWNVGCGEAMVSGVVDELERRRNRDGQPVVLIGHSRGGLLGRVAAVRHPQLVAGLITVCTPWALGPPGRPGVAAVSSLVRLARRHGMRTMGSIDCEHGECCAAFRTDMQRVPTTPWIALWSSTDTIGGPASVPPAGPSSHHDLRTSHLGAVRSARGHAAIGTALRQIRLAPDR